MNRHQRRKRTREKWEALALANQSYENAKTVRRNLASPYRPKRSPKGIGNRSVYSGATGAFATGAAGKKTFDCPNDEMKSRGKVRYRNLDRHVETCFDGIDGSELSGKQLREAANPDLARKCKERAATAKAEAQDWRERHGR